MTFEEEERARLNAYYKAQRLKEEREEEEYHEKQYRHKLKHRELEDI